MVVGNAFLFRSITQIPQRRTNQRCNLSYGVNRHPVILEKGHHVMTLFISSPNGFSEHFCDFMPASEDDVWNPVESLIDSTIIPVNSSWFMIIQLVVLYKCLEAILGPLHYFPNQDD